MPVAFELTVLFSSFGAFFGMWALNGLPRFSNPMFTDPRFDRATDDRFFLYIDSSDDRFDAAGVEKLFAETGANTSSRWSKMIRQPRCQSHSSPLGLPSL